MSGTGKVAERFGQHGTDILAEGDGGGYTVTPDALDAYEAALGLRPAESWLARRMARRAWQHGGHVFISFRKVALQACVNRATVNTLARNLERQGFIRRVGFGGGKSQLDRRIRYDVSGLWAALWVAIAANPESRYAAEHGATPVLAYLKGVCFKGKQPATVAEVNAALIKDGWRCDWATGKCAPLKAPTDGRKT